MSNARMMNAAIKHQGEMAQKVQKKGPKIREPLASEPVGVTGRGRKLGAGGALFLVAAGLASTPAKADFFDGCDIPSRAMIQMQAVRSGDETTFVLTPKYSWKEQSLFVAVPLSWTDGKPNDPYIVVARPIAFDKQQVFIFPWAGTSLTKHGMRNPSVGVALTKLWKDGKFEISPRVSYEVTGHTTAIGATFAAQVAEHVRLGLDVEKVGNGKLTASGLALINVGKHTMVFMQISDTESGAVSTVGVRLLFGK